MNNYLLSKLPGDQELAVTVEQCKQDLKIQHCADDELLEDYVAAACALVGGKDGLVGKVLTSENWELKLASASGCIKLPISPVSEIKSITYFDADDVSQTLDVNDFLLFGDDDQANIEPKPGKSWPTASRRRDAITITFVAGYGASEAVPKNLTRAIRLIVAHWYENRTAVLVGVTAQELPLAVQSLIGISRKGWCA